MDNLTLEKATEDPTLEKATDNPTSEKAMDNPTLEKAMDNPRLEKATEEAEKNANGQVAACNAGNMARYPIVRKYYVFAANFPRLFRYNDLALVYSGLLAKTAVKPACPWPKDRSQ
jgi:hypothetical protein